jgi:hypothetical protein
MVMSGGLDFGEGLRDGTGDLEFPLLARSCSDATGTVGRRYDRGTIILGVESVKKTKGRRMCAGCNIHQRSRRLVPQWVA